MGRDPSRGPDSAWDAAGRGSRRQAQGESTGCVTPARHDRLSSGALDGRHHDHLDTVDDDGLGVALLGWPAASALLCDDLAVHEQLATPHAPRLPSRQCAFEALLLDLAGAADVL